MQNVIPPRSEKENQHYVPRSWLSRFAGKNGRLLGKQGGHIQHQVSVEDIMCGDWIYTIFDEWWRPSDKIEDALAEIEGDAGRLFDKLCATKDAPGPQEWGNLCMFLALTACRHPETMRHGHERSKELAWALADVEQHPNRDIFLASIRQRFGTELPLGTYEALMSKGLEARIAEADEVESLLPYDPLLPEQISLEAVMPVAWNIVCQDLFLLDAPEGLNFVLSDCPLPLNGLAGRFSVPLSKTVAFLAFPADGENLILDRRPATADMVRLVNQEQVNRSRSIIIGPDRGTLNGL